MVEHERSPSTHSQIKVSSDNEQSHTSSGDEIQNHKKGENGANGDCLIKIVTPSSSANVPWSMSMKGKVSNSCFWTACKAATIGAFLILIGSIMATVGFYSDQLSMVEVVSGNVTILVKDEKRNQHLASFTYLGPVVMGFGGFIILAACVMTFEARDTAGKIVPVLFKKPRVHASLGPNVSAKSSESSWEKFLTSYWRSDSRDSDTRSTVTKELLNFSRQYRPSTDSHVLLGAKDTLTKCPSEPNLNKAVNRTCCAELTPTLNNARTSSKLKVPSEGRPYLGYNQLYERQAVSMDCPLPPKLKHQDSEAPSTNSYKSSEEGVKLKGILKKDSDVCRSDSISSMAMDLHLPQGAITISVKDKSKQKKLPEKATQPPSTIRPSILKDSSSRKTSQESSDRSINIKYHSSPKETTKISTEFSTSLEVPTSPMTKPVSPFSSLSSRSKTPSPSLSPTSPGPSESARKSSNPFVLATSQSSTMKRYPLLRQTALDSDPKSRYKNNLDRSSS